MRGGRTGHVLSFAVDFEHDEADYADGAGAGWIVSMKILGGERGG